MVSTQYEDFFTLVAAAGGRLTESSLSDSLRRFRTVNSHRMDAYVNKIVDVQSELWQKAKRMTTGEKLPESMQRICKTYVAATENKSKEQAMPKSLQLPIKSSISSAQKLLEQAQAMASSSSTAEVVADASSDVEEVIAEASSDAEKIDSSSSFSEVDVPSCPDGTQCAEVTSHSKPLTIISYKIDRASGPIGILTAPGQPEKHAPLVHGPDHFALADFGHGPQRTQCPNLTIDAWREKPAPKAKR